MLEAVCWAGEELEWGPKARAISLCIMRTKSLSALRCGMHLAGIFAISLQWWTQAGFADASAQSRGSKYGARHELLHTHTVSTFEEHHLLQHSSLQLKNAAPNSVDADRY